LQKNRGTVKSTLQNLNSATQKLEPLLQDLRKTSAQANQTLDHVDSLIGENRADVRQAVKDLRESLATVNDLTGRLDQTLDVNSDNIDELLENLRHVSQNLKEFTNTIKTRPYTLIRSATPRTQARRETMSPVLPQMKVCNLNKMPGSGPKFPRISARAGYFAVFSLMVGLLTGCGAVRPVKYYQLTVPTDAGDIEKAGRSSRQVAPGGTDDFPFVSRGSHRLRQRSRAIGHRTSFSAGQNLPRKMIQEILLRELRATGHYRAPSMCGAAM